MRREIVRLQRLHDPVAFARLLREVVGERGSENAAAEFLRVSRTRLRQWLAGKCNAIRVSIRERIERRLTPTQRRRLAVAVTSVAGERLLRTVYRPWLERRLYGGRLPKPKRVVIRGTEYFVQVTGGSTIRPTIERLGFEDMLQTFEERHRWHGHARVDLAIHRALLPLLDASSAGGVELSAQELDRRGLLRRYLKSALAAESVLLDRLNDRARAERVATRSRR